MRPRRVLPPLTRVLCLALSVSAGAYTTAPAQHFPRSEDLELMLRYIVEDSIAPGVILGVLEADGTTRIVSHGSGGPDAGPLTAGSTFETGSISKVFAGTLLADMVRRGEVALDDPVSDYLPDAVHVPSIAGREITLLDLATHRSGLPRDHPFTSFTDPYADLTTARLHEVISDAELSLPPGTGYRYSNIGIALLAETLGHAAGESYATLVGERILEPLGMSMSSFALEGEIAEVMTQGHESDGTQPLYTRPEAVYGPGGLRSNVPDLLKFVEAQIGFPENELEESMRLAHDARANTDDGRIGLAWMTNEIRGRSLVWHGGTTGGFTTLIAFDPERRIGVVLMANVEPFGDDLGFSLLAQQLTAPEDWGASAVDPALLRQYAGTYEPTSGRGRRFYVRLEEGGTLTYQPAGRARARLYPTSDSTFYLLRGAYTFTFEIDGQEAGVGLRMEQDERSDSPGEAVTAYKVSNDAPSPVAAAGGGWYQPDEKNSISIWGFVALAAFVVLILLMGPFRPARWT